MKLVRPGVICEVAGHLQEVYGISERRACQASGFDRSSQRYRKQYDRQVAMRMRPKELAAPRVAEQAAAGMQGLNGLRLAFIASDT